MTNNISNNANNQLGLYTNGDIEIPLNVLKEKLLYCLPPDTEIEDDALKVMSLSLGHF